MHTHAHMHTCTYMHTHMRTHTHSHTHMHTHTHTHTHTLTHMHMHMHTCVRTHTHMQTRPRTSSVSGVGACCTASSSSLCSSASNWPGEEVCAEATNRPVWSSGLSQPPATL